MRGADPEYLTYFGDHSLILKSHGHSHMTFFKNRFSRKGLFLLDEPENALSPGMQLELVRLLRQLVNRGDVQFIIATYSPLLLAVPGRRSTALIAARSEGFVRKIPIITGSTGISSTTGRSTLMKSE